MRMYEIRGYFRVTIEADSEEEAYEKFDEMEIKEVKTDITDCCGWTV